MSYLTSHRWCIIHPKGHYLTREGLSGSTEAQQLISVYKRAKQAFIVPQDDRVTDYNFEERLMNEIRVFNDGLGGSEESEEGEPSEGAVECDKCGRHMMMTRLKEHLGECTGRVSLN